ncbi:MAG TPA: hypothetical protein VD735_05685 [Candidatus Saccharimonadales bacterium]|nr:hypothetical protein [Candidatus Saccharimonadales bacterium]
MGQNNIIELNGKQYDAITGAMLSQSRIKATPEKRQAAHARAGRAIDGIVRSGQPNAAAMHAAPKQAVRVAGAAKPAHSKPLAKTGKKFDVARPAIQHIKPHSTERSKTLMRHVVAKPVIARKPAIKKSAPSELAAKPVSDIAKQLEKKLSVTQVDPIRLAHAQHIAKSHHVKRFHHAVKQPHIQPAAPHTRVHADVQRPSAPTAFSVLTPEAAAPAPNPASTDIFEAALARATSHKQPTVRASSRKSNRNRKLVSVLAGIGAFVVIGGFITYLNAPAIELRVASMQAGFSIQKPSYQPTGYAMSGGIEHNDGKAVLSFRSGDSSYQITQVASNWNSQTLLDYYTENHGAPAQTVQSQGRIIYLYDDTRAAWVNGGVRYEINGSAALTADDLVSLATSM